MYPRLGTHDLNRFTTLEIKLCLKILAYFYITTKRAKKDFFIPQAKQIFAKHSTLPAADDDLTFFVFSVTYFIS